MREQLSLILRWLTILGASLVLTSCFGPDPDPVVAHLLDLETQLTASTNTWQMVRLGSSSMVDGPKGKYCHCAFWAFKKRVDPGQFCGRASELIQRFVVAQGGAVVESERMPGMSVSPDYRSEAAETSGQLIMYRVGSYRGSISVRATMFDRGTEAGHFYFEQTSLK